MTTQKSVEAQLESLSEQLEAKLEKQQKEQIFAEKANLMFERNLLAFKQFFPEIYDRFLHYNPDEKFQLILNENGTANIIDYETGVPMYSEDPISQAKEQAEKNINAPILGRTDHSKVSLIENPLDFCHIKLMKNMGSVYLEAKQELELNNTLDEVMPSLIVFGIGLGYHLPYLLDSKKISFINILEPNEDYFFASLFVTDWQEILEHVNQSGSYLYLGIGKTEVEIFQDIYERSRNVGVASVSFTWFYQHYPSVTVNNWINQFKVNFHQFFTGFGFFDDALMGVAHTLGNVDNGLNLMVNHLSQVSVPKYDNFPIVIIANGPSLDKEIEALQSIKDKVVIFSCNSASTALIQYGIIPDFHVALERTEQTYHFLKDYLPESARSKINFLTTNVMHPSVSSLFPWTGFGLKGNESATQLIQLSQVLGKHEFTGSLSYCNPLVGNTALSFACHLNFKNIYLFGVDNGYIDETHHHSKSSFYYNDKGETVHQPLKMGKQIVLPGNFAPSVLTDEFMSVGNSQMEKLVDLFVPKGTHFFNCSNGAKIKGAIPLKSEDIFLENTQIDKHEVIEFIKSTKFSAPYDAEKVESYLQYNEFEEFCSTFANILKEDVSTRGDALDALLKSIRYLYSFKDNAKYLNIFLMMEGETLYTTALLISLLYNFGDEEQIMPYYLKALQHWIEFIDSAPEYYKANIRLCK